MKFVWSCLFVIASAASAYEADPPVPSPLVRQAYRNGLVRDDAWTSAREVRALVILSDRGENVPPGQGWRLLEDDERLLVWREEAAEAEADREIAFIRQKWSRPGDYPAPSALAEAQIERGVGVLLGRDADDGLRERLAAHLRRLVHHIPERETREHWELTARVFPGDVVSNLEYKVDVLSEVMGLTVRRLLAARRAGDRLAEELRLEDAILIVGELYLTIGANAGDRERLFQRADQTNVAVVMPSTLLTGFTGPLALAQSGLTLKAVAAVSGVAAAGSFVAALANITRRYQLVAAPVVLPRWVKRRELARHAAKKARDFWRAMAIELMHEPEWLALEGEDDASFERDQRWRAVEPLVPSLVKILAGDHSSLAPACAALLAR